MRHFFLAFLSLYLLLFVCTRESPTSGSKNTTAVVHVDAVGDMEFSLIWSGEVPTLSPDTTILGDTLMVIPRWDKEFEEVYVIFFEPHPSIEGEWIRKIVFRPRR